MSDVLPLRVVTPLDSLAPVATGGSPAESSPRDVEEYESGGVDSAYEQSAAAALLGLCAAWPSSPDDETNSDGQPSTELGADAEHHWDYTARRAGGILGYGSPSDGLHSPKNFRHHLEYDTPGYPSPKRMRAPKDGAPPPGTSRFRCKFPGCSKLYASTDAVRKHCRKRHLEWLRQIDRYSAHERGLPKPALYCVWGGDDEA